MKFNPDIHNRKTLRLKNYNYSSEGLYFITISVKDKLCLFSEIKNDIMNLFESGKMIEKYWLELENKFDVIKLHNYIVMPNHFHGIIEIVNNNNNNNNNNVGAGLCACPNSKGLNINLGGPNINSGCQNINSGCQNINSGGPKY